jgi:hypothetical protein
MLNLKGLFYTTKVQKYNIFGIRIKTEAYSFIT